MISGFKVQTRPTGQIRPGGGNPSSVDFGGVLPIFIAIGVLGVILFLLAKLSYGRKRRRRRHSSSAPTPVATASVARTSDSDQRVRRAHRQRNPTLAETGGLPPPREAPPQEPAK
jgi:hypothetical protein